MMVQGKLGTEQDRRETFFRELSESVAVTRADPEAWAEEENELSLWDQTNLDGLENE